VGMWQASNCDKHTTCDGGKRMKFLGARAIGRDGRARARACVCVCVCVCDGRGRRMVCHIGVLMWRPLEYAPLCVQPQGADAGGVDKLRQGRRHRWALEDEWVGERVSAKRR
jgi:hypothetical protein